MSEVFTHSRFGQETSYQWGVYSSLRDALKDVKYCNDPRTLALWPNAYIFKDGKVVKNLKGPGFLGASFEFVSDFFTQKLTPPEKGDYHLQENETTNSNPDLGG